MKRRAVPLALLAVLAVANGYANETASIVGTIQDPDATYSGLCWVMAIPCVSMLDCATGGAPTVIKAATLKEFRIPDLEPGLYKVAVVSSGPGAWASSTFFLPSGQTAIVSPVLPEVAGSSGIVFDSHMEEDLNDYSDLLSALEEPPLCASPNEGSSQIERYRFIWLRTWYPPVIVTLSLYGPDGFTARYKEGSTEDWYEGQELMVDEVTNVVDHLTSLGFDDAEALEFREHISEQAVCDGFWESPYMIEDGSIVLDGSMWIVEGVKNGDCHLAQRQSPVRQDPIREFAWRIMSYTGRQFIYEEVF